MADSGDSVDAGNTQKPNDKSQFVCHFWSISYNILVVILASHSSLSNPSDLSPNLNICST